MKRLCFCVVVLFLFAAWFSSCSFDAENSLPYEPDLESERNEETPNLQPDEDGETSDEEGSSQEGDEKPEAKAAEFLYGKFISETKIEFEFTFPVRVLSLSFEPPLEVDSVEDGNNVQVLLNQSAKPGKQFKVYIEVEDEWDNTIFVEKALLAPNNRTPKLRINELRTEWSSATNRTEFIEFKILSDGNLGGLRVFAASNGANPMIYQFSPVEVRAGDYVVLHLRTLEEDLAVSEYGDCLEESMTRDSSPTARDIWIPGSTKLLRKTEEAVYVMDPKENVLDAVMLSDNHNAEWRRVFLAEAARFLFEKGAWSSPEGEVSRPLDAVNTSGIGTSLTRSVSRDETAENAGNATNWYITSVGGATPGLPNRL